MELRERSASVESYFRFTRASPWFRIGLSSSWFFWVGVKVNGFLDISLLIPVLLAAAYSVIVRIVVRISSSFGVLLVHLLPVSLVEDQKTGAQSLERGFRREDEVVGGATGHSSEQWTEPVDLNTQTKDALHNANLA